ncbi:MAG: hypothetical protein ACK5LT_09370 [Lachnospirales bacterium]
MNILYKNKEIIGNSKEKITVHVIDDAILNYEYIDLPFTKIAIGEKHLIEKYKFKKSFRIYGNKKLEATIISLVEGEVPQNASIVTTYELALLDCTRHLHPNFTLVYENNNNLHIVNINNHVEIDFYTFSNEYSYKNILEIDKTLGLKVNSNKIVVVNNIISWLKEYLDLYDCEFITFDLKNMPVPSINLALSSIQYKNYKEKNFSKELKLTMANFAYCLCIVLLSFTVFNYLQNKFKSIDTSIITNLDTELTLTNKLIDDLKASDIKENIEYKILNDLHHLKPNKLYIENNINFYGYLPPTKDLDYVIDYIEKKEYINIQIKEINYGTSYYYLTFEVE